MWYQSARLITVQIALLLGCFCSIAVATIGYVAAMLLVQIEEEEVSGRVKFQGHMQVCKDWQIFVLLGLFGGRTTSWRVVASRRAGEK